MDKLSWIRSRLSLIDVENPSHVDDEEATPTMRPKRRGGARLLSHIRRNSGYIFFVCVFVLFMRTGFLAGNNMHLQPNSSTPAGVEREHPITRLMDDAETAYRRKLAGQSKTLKAAVGEYKRRYKRSPPRGFDSWWKFAKENGVKFVDEYDGLVEDLKPFWELSGVELRRRVQQVGELPSIDLVRIKDGNVTTLKVNNFQDSEVSARANGFRDMISKFAHTLPDMDFSINAKAEGRVLVPWEHRQYPNLTIEDSSVGIESILGGPFRPDWGTDGTVWDSWRRTCPPTSPARRLFSSHLNTLTTSPTSHQSLTFPRTTTFHTLDFCHHPSHHTTQGHFFSDWRTLSLLYPVFSPARARGFLDIRIPSHYYYGSTARYTYGWDEVNLELHPEDPMEVPWEDKEDKVFWRGATTGGGSHPPGFTAGYQRHRFVRLAGENSSTPRLITSSSLETTRVPISVLNERIMDVAFTKSVSVEDDGVLKLPMGDAVPLGRHWAYKYLVDMDGMGYSGRFMAFLASDSVPLKATVYEEFFSDWIQPWLHFIPLSPLYNEIYNIHAYFSGPVSLSNTTTMNATTTTNDKKLRRIARAGKEWKRNVGRIVDMEVYVYRLALEWARLWADDRDSMGFEL